MSNFTMRRILFVAKLMAWVVVAVKGASAQVASLRTVVSNGGGVMKGSRLLVQGTTGQRVIGSLPTARKGFWYGISSPLALAPGSVLGPTLSSSPLGIAPNPASRFTSVTIDLDKPSEVVIRVTDLQGRILRVIDAGMREHGRITIPIDVALLPDGSYLISVTTGDRRLMGRIVVMK